jgi:two-component system nitrate/nitrite sensor histidine kinase NarX
MRLAGAQGGAVRLLDEADEQLHLVSQIDPPPTPVPGREPAPSRHCGFCGQAANEPRVVWAHDLSPAGWPPGAAHADICAGRMLAVPLQHRARCWASTTSSSTRRANPGPKPAGLLKTVGELLGLALHNARLEARTCVPRCCTNAS